MANYTKIAVKGALTVLILSLLAGFFGYIVRLILARGLSVEDFGLFYSVFAFLGLFAVFKTLGFDKALVKFIPEFIQEKKYSEAKSSMIYAAIIQLITSTIIILIVYALAGFLADAYFQDPKAGIVLKLMAFAFFFDSFTQVLKFAFQGFRKMAYFAGIDLIRMAMISALILVGFKLNYGILSPAVAYIIAPIILTVIFFIILRKKVFPRLSESKLFWDGKLFRDISKYGIFVMATTVGGVILGYTDIIILTYFSGLAAVGLYSVALPTAKVLLYFPRAIGGILLPLTSEFWAQRKNNLIAAGLESLYKYSIILIIPAVFVVFSFAGIIISLFFGESYFMAANALKILSIGMIFATLSGISANFFSGIGKPQINSKIVYTAAIFNLIANLILIPVFGIIGAAIATTISYFIMMVIGLIDTRKFIKLRLPIFIWVKTLVAGLLFTLVIWWMKNALVMNLWIEIILILIISGIFYIALLFLFKIVNIEEIRDLYRKVLR